MVDLHRVGRLGPADERDRLAAVRVVQRAALGEAGAGPHDQLGEVAAQDVVAGVASVVAELDVDVVAPGLAEPVSGEVGAAIPPLDGQLAAASPSPGRIRAWPWPTCAAGGARARLGA